MICRKEPPVNKSVVVFEGPAKGSAGMKDIVERGNPVADDPETDGLLREFVHEAGATGLPAELVDLAHKLQAKIDEQRLGGEPGGGKPLG
jgi:hypothetical protein